MMAPERQGNARAAQQRRVVVIALIVLLGAVLRFVELGAVRHSHDDSYSSYQAVKMLDTGTPVLIGQPSSIFLDNPPLMVYLQALPLLVWRSPWAIYVVVVALNTSAIWFLYDLTEELMDAVAAALAAVLFAVNPWIVHFSRTTWVQSLVPVFLVVICWGLWPALAGRQHRPARIVVGLVAACVMMLTYVQAFGVLFQIVPLVLLFWKCIPVNVRWVGAALLIVLFVVYGAGLLSEPERNLDKLASLSTSESGARFTSDGLQHAARLVTGRGFAAVWADAGTTAAARLQLLERGFNLLLELSLGLGIVAAVSAIVTRRAERVTAIMLLIWFFVPVLLTSYTSQLVHVHYLLLALPAGSMLAGTGLSLLHKKGLRWALGLVLACAVLSAAINLHSANQIALKGRFNDDFKDWPLVAGSRVGTTIRALLPEAGGGTWPPRIVAAGDRTIWSSLSATYIEPLRDVAYPDVVVVPADDALLYVIKNDVGDPPLVQPELEHLTQSSLRLANGATVDFLRTHTDASASVIGGDFTAIQWPSDAGLSLLSYQARGDPTRGEPLQLTVVWQVAELLPVRHEAFIAGVYRLVDESGAVLASADTHGQWGYRWCLGDVYIERRSFLLPSDFKPGRYALHIGLFDPIHERVYAFSAPDGWTATYVAPLTFSSLSNTD